MLDVLRAAGARFWITAILWTVVFGVALGIPTVMLDNPLFRRMTPVEPWQYPVWILSALGAGMVLAARKLPQNANCTVEGRTISGAGISYLALGCPICNKVVVAAIGVSGALDYFAPLQPLLAAAALTLLLVTLRRMLAPPSPSGRENHPAGATV